MNRNHSFWSFWLIQRLDIEYRSLHFSIFWMNSVANKFIFESIDCIEMFLTMHGNNKEHSFCCIKLFVFNTVWLISWVVWVLWESISLNGRFTCEFRQCFIQPKCCFRCVSETVINFLNWNVLFYGTCLAWGRAYVTETLRFRRIKYSEEV